MMEPKALDPVWLGEYDLLLRPWEPRDLGAVLRGISDPDFRRWNAVTVPAPDEEGAREFLERRAAGWRMGDQASFAITTEGDGFRAVVGHVGLAMIDPMLRSARVAYWVLPEHRGRGYASRALETVTRWAFRGELGLYRVELGHVLPNHASCRVAGHCAYAYEGTMRGALPGIDGRMWDVHLHARLAIDPAPDLRATTAR